jgi:hypothetical protein
MRDPILVLGWVWAVYLVLRLVVEAIRTQLPPGPRRRGRASAAHASAASDPAQVAPHQGAGKRSWTPIPALVWLAGEAVAAAVVVGVAWVVLRDVSVNLVPAAVSAAPEDVRRVALAAILGWSLIVIDGPVGMRLVGRLLPPESQKVSGGVDPERMGATIGVLERLLVVALTPSGGPAAVGFVVAAKTLARFKELRKKRIADRYLLGTMASVTVALVSALAAAWIWTNAI